MIVGGQGKGELVRLTPLQLTPPHYWPMFTLDVGGIPRP